MWNTVSTYISKIHHHSWVLRLKTIRIQLVSHTWLVKMYNAKTDLLIGNCSFWRFRFTSGWLTICLLIGCLLISGWLIGCWFISCLLISGWLITVRWLISCLLISSWLITVCWLIGCWFISCLLISSWLITICWLISGWLITVRWLISSLLALLCGQWIVGESKKLVTKF